MTTLQRTLYTRYINQTKTKEFEKGYFSTQFTYCSIKMKNAILYFSFSFSFFHCNDLQINLQRCSGTMRRHNKRDSAKMCAVCNRVFCARNFAISSHWVIALFKINTHRKKSNEPPCRAYKNNRSFKLSLRKNRSLTNTWKTF